MPAPPPPATSLFGSRWLALPFVLAAVSAFFVIIGVFGLMAAELGLVVYLVAVGALLRASGRAGDGHDA